MSRGEMPTLVREVADTHGPDPEQLMEWDSQLGPAGKSQLYNILVTKANMPESWSSEVFLPKHWR